jgi:hypothetical protein
VSFPEAPSFREARDRHETRRGHGARVIELRPVFGSGGRRPRVRRRLDQRDPTRSVPAPGYRRRAQHAPALRYGRRHRLRSQPDRTGSRPGTCRRFRRPPCSAWAPRCGRTSSGASG